MVLLPLRVQLPFIVEPRMIPDSSWYLHFPEHITFASLFIAFPKLFLFIFFLKHVYCKLLCEELPRSSMPCKRCIVGYSFLPVFPPLLSSFLVQLIELERCTVFHYTFYFTQNNDNSELNLLFILLSMS